MNEAVDRVIEQREAMDRGFPAGVVLSVLFHVLLVGAAFGAAWLGPREPLLRVANVIAVPVPPGGGGDPAPEPAPGVAPAAPLQSAPPAPAPEPPPKVIKPPKKEEPRKDLPPPDAKKVKPKPEKNTAPSRSVGPPSPEGRAAQSGTTGAGTNSVVPGGVGIIGPAGPGAPGGTDALGDWYLAGVQRKIWLGWTRGVRTGFSQPITVSFTILADGSLEDGSVHPVQASGIQLIDNAALRAVYSAAPFAPLPRSYGTNRITIQALFQPIP